MAKGCGDFVHEGEKYFNLLNQMFVQDPEIEEVDIIFCPQCKVNQEEKTICAMINEKHILGIRSWCVQPLYMYAYNKLLRARKHKGITCYNSLSATDILQLSRAVLLLSAECYTVWNMRKELVMTSVLNIDDDLQLSSLILSKHPRSAETFSHRKWLIVQYVKQKGRSKYIQEWLRKELCICLYCADHYSDNYVAWTHRGWITEEFIDSKKKYLSELHAMEKWVQMHISDHCGFHFRQKLLTKLKEMSSVEDMVLLLLEEMVFVTNLQDSFPGHECTWSHRRFIVEHWHLWFGSVPFSYLQQLVALSKHSSQQEASHNVTCVQRCWAPCVKSLSSLCGSALKVKSLYGKGQEDSLSSMKSNAMEFFLVESELEYCKQVQKKSRNDDRFVSGYEKWLVLRYGKENTHSQNPLPKN
ncbi:protein prenyltransferase alpha subunit repeat-containing protein 1-like [Actinia tenebrosa]|uniref:Protein prenyltransferase alpha subunit repeat-containing protein 1-like n=1 Tax=Actinia tenebrosa TaxID=6105 RepID=A0A6P8IEQ9_ACTTE|nr:protein prenyltransferase alpha subunit repeat-containing protein 1-like [Actinia tenebrosa]